MGKFKRNTPIPKPFQRTNLGTAQLPIVPKKNGNGNNNKNGKSLTKQRELFCRQYVVDFNGRKAAIRAKYNPESAATRAADLLALPEVQNKIADLMAAQALRLEISADRILKELACIAFFDIRGLYEPDGGLKPIDSWTREQAAAVSGLKFKDLKKMGEHGWEKVGQLVSVQHYNKVQVLELLGKHVGMFEEKFRGKMEFAFRHTKEFRLDLEDLKSLPKEKLEALAGILAGVTPANTERTDGPTGAGGEVPQIIH